MVVTDQVFVGHLGVSRLAAAALGTTCRVRGSSCIASRSGSRRGLAVGAGAKPDEGSASSKGFSILEITNKLLPQGVLVQGVKLGWRSAWQLMVRELAPQSKTGAYVRPKYSFDGRIGDAAFPAASGRYHLYLGNACGWCHRVLLTLVLRGLAGHVSVSQLTDDAEKARRGGWVFDAQNPDPVFGAQDLWEVYDTASPGFRGRCTAPLLLDKQTRRIVCNESSDILRMLNRLQLPGATHVDLYPEALHGQIDELNDMIYEDINNGVYRSGFATTQAAYDDAQTGLYRALGEVEARLSKTRFLLGDKCTECDVRLYPTIARFDAVYATIFKCSRKRISDYPHLTIWLKDMYQIKVSDTLDVDAARRSYSTNLFPLNPSGIIPSGPTAADLHLDDPVQRGSRELTDMFHQTLHTQALQTNVLIA
ncbi:MAG: hypothetical protein WDW36_002831 [Sanguina aurantia]